MVSVNENKKLVLLADLFEEESSFKYLGVFIDTPLNFGLHIEHVGKN